MLMIDNYIIRLLYTLPAEVYDLDMVKERPLRLNSR